MQIKVNDRDLNEIGSIVTRNCNCSKEIKMRIVIGKEAFNRKISLFTSKQIGLRVVFGALLYIAQRPRHFFLRSPPPPHRVTSGIVPIPLGPSQCPMLKLYYKLIPTSRFMAWLGYILLT